MTPDDSETRVHRAQADPQLLVGTVLAGRYRIQELLGVGAMGAVYLGQHLKIGRKDAIKVLNAAMARDPDAIARFDRGARNVGAIRHPNVCTIYDFSDTDDGLQYLAMEYVRGESLKDLLDRGGPLSFPRALRIATQTASALHAAHAAGVVHRDLKPANIMVSREPDGDDIVKVVDFDISKGSDEEVKVEVTRLGFVIGTPEYMSPEQLCDDKLDGRSDVYSLALVVYRMLTGGLPFRGETVQDLMMARLSDTPLVRLEELVPGGGFPPRLQDVLDRALKRRVSERTASAAEFAAELSASAARIPEAAIPQTVVAPAVARVAPAVLPLEKPPVEKYSLRRPLMAGLSVLALAIVGGLAVRFAFFGGDDTGSKTEDPSAQTTSTDAGGGGPVNPPITDSTGARDPGPVIPAGGGGIVKTDSGNTGRGGPAGNTGSSGSGTLPPKTGMEIPADRAVAILDAQRERLIIPPLPERAVLRAMRDTAVTIHGMSTLDDRQRALAAFIAASVALSLDERDSCVTWATRAQELAPTTSSYARMVNTCRAGTQ